MKKIIAISLASLMVSSVSNSSDYAGYAGAFLRSGMGARPLGMGGAYTAIAEGPEATYYNPGGLGFLTRSSISTSYQTLSLDRHFGHVAVSFPIRNEAAMAASWVYSGVSDITGRGESRQIFGQISNSSNAFTLSFAKAFNPDVSAGATLRYLTERLDDLESFTVGVDAGVIGRIYQNFTGGAFIQNLGSQHKWESSRYWSDGSTYEEPFPIIVKLGLAGEFYSGNLIGAVDYETSDQGGMRLRAGAEYWFTRKVTREVEDEYEEGVMRIVEDNIRQAGLRIGLDRGSPTFGASFYHDAGIVSLGVEYAFLFGREGTSSGHLFTLGIGF